MSAARTSCMRAAGLAVAALLLLANALAASISPIRGDQPLAPLTYADASGSNAHVATDGGLFFVVWETDHAVLGTRVSHDGTPLDVPPRVISTGPYSRYANAHVTYAGGHYLVAWSGGDAIYLRLFARDGTPLGVEKRVSADPYDSFLVLTSDGTHVALATTRFPWCVLLLFDADGNPTGGPFYIMSNADPVGGAANANEIAIATTDRICLLRWDGTEIATSAFPDDFIAWAVAANDHGFLVVDNDRPSVFTVDAAGVLGARVDLAQYQNPFRRPVAAWDGNRWSVAWMESDDLVRPLVASVHLLPTGQFDGYFYYLPPGVGFIDSLAIAGGDHLFLTTTFGGWIEATLAASLENISVEPAARRLFTIATSAAEQRGGASASTPAKTLTVWAERATADGWIFRGALADANGPKPPFDLPFGRWTGPVAPVVASDGRRFAVVVASAGMVGFQIVNEDGSLGRSDSLLRTSPVKSLAVAWSGQAFVFGWYDGIDHAAAFSAEGRWINDDTPLSGFDRHSETADQISIGCADGTCYYAAAVFDSLNDAAMYVARVSPDVIQTSKFTELLRKHMSYFRQPAVVAGAAKPLIVFGEGASLKAVAVDGGAVTELWKTNEAQDQFNPEQPHVVGGSGDTIY